MIKTFTKRKGLGGFVDSLKKDFRDFEGCGITDSNCITSIERMGKWVN